MTRSYQIFARQLLAAVEAYPTLSIVDEGGKKFLRGTFDVVDDEGKFWESFDIEIRCQEGFPNCFPKLIEVGGKIPKIADWHTYTDGSCCITVPPNERLICRNEITVLDFIQTQVRPHLANQAHRRKEGYYVNGEYGHGIEGHWQFYEKELGTTDKAKILKILLVIAKGERPGKKDACFCGSGRRYPRCHKNDYIRLSKLGKKYLLGERDRLLKDFERR